MHLILLSGGSGKRLWPLSNHSRSKQFLKLLPSEQIVDGNISMIQRIWKQIQKAKLDEMAIISTGQSQVDLIKSQLNPHIPLVVEPERRDTYPAIALSSLYLSSIKKVNPHEVVVVIPVDIYVDEDFFNHLTKLECIVKQSTANMVLVGIHPTFPSEKYGYIVCNQSKDLAKGEEVQLIDYFIEKPNKEKAVELIGEGALWNAGVFAFKLSFILEYLEAQKLPLVYEEMIKKYACLSKNSFDYEIVEKAKSIAVTSYKGKWKDLGTWNALTEEIQAPLIGKGNISVDCQNVHVINELDIPVSVIGVENLIVAVSPDGILVSDKAVSPRIKEISNQFEQRPMYEERRWGWYRVLDYTKFDDRNEVLTKRVCVEAGKNLSYQKHLKRNEVWTIISGTGLFALDGEIVEVQRGDILKISIGSLHGIKAITELEFIEVQSGIEVVEEDIIRIYMTWEEVEQNCKIVERK